MFARLLYQSFLRQRRRKLLAGAAVALGVSVATAMIAVATDVGDKIKRELRSNGANLVGYPQDEALEVNLGGVNVKPASDNAYLHESDLPRIKGIFWRHNIVGFAPMLPVTADVTAGTAATKAEVLGTYLQKQLRFGKETFTTGVRVTHPWWKVSGAWPKDDSREVLVGESLARRLGTRAGEALRIGGREVHVAGVLSADVNTDGQIVAPLSLAQEIGGRPGAVRRIFVSALTKPEDAFARRDPRSMTREEYDRWYCSPYVNSIALQLEEAIPGGRAEQIRQVAQNEGTVLSRISGLMLLVALAALAASSLAVGAAMATAIFERRGEIGLMKAMGAGRGTVAALFMAESAVLALAGGVAGFLAGSLLAQQIGRMVFGSAIAVQPVLLPLVLAVAALVTFAGSAAPIRRAMKLDPALVLRSEA